MGVFWAQSVGLPSAWDASCSLLLHRNFQSCILFKIVCNWKYILGPSSETDAVPAESSNSLGRVLVEASEPGLSV